MRIIHVCLSIVVFQFLVWVPLVLNEHHVVLPLIANLESAQNLIANILFIGMYFLYVWFITENEALSLFGVVKFQHNSLVIASCLALVIVIAQYLLLGSYQDSLLINKAREFDELARVFSVLNAVIISPILEEMIFRGILLSSLLTVIGRVSAITVSSMLWAILHIETFGVYGVAFLFIYSVALCKLRIFSGSIIPGVFTHAIVNAIWLFIWM